MHRKALAAAAVAASSLVVRAQTQTTTVASPALSSPASVAPTGTASSAPSSALSPTATMSTTATTAASAVPAPSLIPPISKPVLTTAAATTTTAADSQPTTLVAVNQAAVSPPNCISLASTSQCPSYKAYYFNANSAFVRQQVGAQDGSQVSVQQFDLLVQRWASAPSGTLLGDIQCKTWDPAQIRYATQFFCDYFLQDPYVIGDDSGTGMPGSQGDCNVIVNSGNPPSPASLPRISTYACQNFFNSTFDFISSTQCVGSTGASRGAFKTNVANVCASATKATGTQGFPDVDMINVDNSTEHLRCGYADKNGNKTSGLFSAFLHCYHFTTDPCCIQDPQIIKALNAGGVYPDPAPPAWNCIITFNRFFILSCGQLSGAVTGILLSLLSIAIIYVGVSRQDLAAMRQTRSGRDRARYSWVQGWWNNSAFANPAARPASVLLKPTLTAAAGGGGGSQTGRQPALFSPERAQFQRFEDENTTLGEDVTRLRAYSRGPSPGDLRRSGVPRANGVDPLAEMMGGGGGAPAPAMVPEGVPAYRAVYEFRGAPGSVEMELVRVGERLVVLQVNGDGSAVVRSLESGRQGVVPVDILSR